MLELEENNNKKRDQNEVELTRKAELLSAAEEHNFYYDLCQTYKGNLCQLWILSRGDLSFLHPWYPMQWTSSRA